MPEDPPFFLAAGFFLPHVPCYATQPWFDLYPDDDSVLPPIREDDREDTPRFSWYIRTDQAVWEGTTIRRKSPNHFGNGRGSYTRGNASRYAQGLPPFRALGACVRLIQDRQ